MHWLAVATLLAPQGVPGPGPAADFARDVQPILVESCYACHGPDAASRKAGLRLDTRAGATADRDGRPAIVPGDPDASEVLRRIAATDSADERMPPPDSGKPALTAAQIRTIRRWIAQGAEWGRHWSFVAPRRPELPPVAPVDGARWVRNEIDAFVLASLQAAGFEPSPEADRRTLIRRLSFDLTGLPPEPDAVEAFVADRASGAYERLVDALLASPHYGERMAMVWLDAARYADTDGFQADATRTNWPWRDWVVDAYNRNVAFDEFTLQQFAGDLLPGAAPEQILATCFHRNHMTNGEGGRDPEESRVDYVIDRVNTLGTVWLGMTLGCSQCHDHKYDPVSQREYYALSAFFDSIDEDGRAGRGAKPYLKFRSPQAARGLAAAERWLGAKRDELKRAEAAARRRFEPWLAEQARRVAAGHRSWRPIRAASRATTDGTALVQVEDRTFHVSGPNPRHDDYVVTTHSALPRITGMRLVVLPAAAAGRGLSLAGDGHVILTNLKVSVATRGVRQAREVAIASAVADYQKKKKGDKAYGPVRDVLDDDPRTGWSTAGSPRGEPRTAVFAFAEPVVLGADDELVIELRHRSLAGHANIRRFRIELTDELGPTLREARGRTPLELLGATLARGGLADLGDADREGLVDQFLAGDASVLAAREVVGAARKRRDEYRRAANGPVDVMVMRERGKPRSTHVLARGVWNQKRDRVTRATPAALGPWPEDAPLDRRGLARFLVDERNPLTARVAVNRYWQMYFGVGLVRTPEDFGRQGEMPTHPRLLDWLATEFVASGWDVKHVQRLIVTSATYRQSSRVTPELLARDPENRLLARAGRFRLPSWMIRDAALQASGLLARRMGGPPVFPHQPEGAWLDSTMGRFRYRRSVGDDLYRRSIYGFWRRLAGPTWMFDAPKRRVCQVRVVRTNTPLHALTLMNDTTFVEAARVLAARALDAAADDAGRIAAIVRRVLSRPPDAFEAGLLARQLDAVRGHYATREPAAAALVSCGDAPARRDLDARELAAFTVIASTVLNLDEAMTRE